ncbi:MAG TPA: DUF1013 domain-containing protein [Rhodobiaceae bacterium]|nr:DUF1013 domain-containing protein [Rhodobiaceae bacterium]
MSFPLMPKATAVWLIDNTALSFDQIADFCGLHSLEVKGIADGDVAQGIKGLDPISNGQVTRDELERCQQDPESRLKLSESRSNLPEQKKKKGANYTPLSKRQERPDAIYWLVRNHPELNDAQVSRLIGTTKPTIQSIRNRDHWNMGSLKPVDPVTLGLCKQIDLDTEVEKAAKRVDRQQKQSNKTATSDVTLMPADKVLEPEIPTYEEDKPLPSAEPSDVFDESPTPESLPAEEETPSAETVFGNFGTSTNEDN